MCSTLGNSAVDNITYDGDTADGEMLVNLGTRIQNPLLTLIGMAIRNQHPCSEWAQWTTCTAQHSRYFGIKKRTRTCNTDKRTGVNTLRKLEEDVSVCVGALCPADYNLTANGFCLKFYGLSKNWNETDKICRNDGGNLVYIGNDEKFNDVKKMLEGVKGFIWIDGRRNDIRSPWKSSDGNEITKFYWLSGQPNNGGDELCLVLDPETTRGWHDASCLSSYLAFCEITV